MFLDKPQSDRWAVPLLIPVSTVISRQEHPCARRMEVVAALTMPGGLTGDFPLAFAGPHAVPDKFRLELWPSLQEPTVVNIQLFFGDAVHHLKPRSAA
jgi:hypothetical protein